MSTTEDTCKVGDPDPTPDVPPVDWCPSRAEGRHRYICTRRAHTTGQHVAGNGDHVVAVWPQD